MRQLALILLLAALMGCQPSDTDPATAPGERFDARITEHREGDDLLTAGLGLTGLMSTAPQPANPDSPEPEALRRMAIHGAWTALSALNPAGGVGGLLESLPSVPGREFAAFRSLPDRNQPVRVLVQLPDSFDPDRPCLVVAPASGSRGVYGALPLAGAWALPAGCAVAYTDKGAGTDFFDFGDRTGVALSGQRVRQGSEALGFEPGDAPDEEDLDHVAMSHAHSGDHPEADWGAHVLDAVRFGLSVLNHALDGEFSADNTRVIAAGLSNGAGAALRAAEQDREGLIDAVVAVMPNITPPGAPHLYDYASFAALYQPCMLADLEATMAKPLGNPLLAAAGAQRCAALASAGLLEEPDAGLARERLLEFGFDEAALSLAPVNAALDLWRSVLVSYASAYLRSGPFDMPCDFALIAPAASDSQRHGWWATHSGIGPGGGIEMQDGRADGRDTALPGLECLRALWTGNGALARQLRDAAEATRASAELPDIPVLIVHGREDGLVPAAFSSRPYVESARANGARLAYWEVTNSQHFDALLAAPGVGDRMVPMLPYGWHALDHVQAVLDGEDSLGDDRLIETSPAPAGQALEWQNLGLVR